MAIRACPILVPCLGRSERFGRQTPKGLLTIELSGTRMPMISHVLSQYHHEWHPILIVPQKYRYDFLAAALKVHPGSSVIPIAGGTDGQSQTILLGLHHIHRDRDVGIQNCDTIIHHNVLKLLMGRPGANTICLHRHDEGDPVFSYVDHPGVVSRVEEKMRISSWAQTGFWHFRSSDELAHAIQSQIASGITHNNEYYLSGAMNQMGEKFARGVVVSEQEWVDLGTPEAVQESGGAVL